MNLLVGGALAPSKMPPSLPPAPPRGGPGLRLPCFEQLGIAAPHPDKVDGVLKSNTVGSREVEEWPSRFDGGCSERALSAGIGAISPFSSTEERFVNPELPIRAGRAIQFPFHHYVDTITPPAEGGVPDWNMPPTVATAGMDSPKSEPAGTSSGTAEMPSPNVVVGVGAGAGDDDQEATTATGPSSFVDEAVDTLRKQSPSS